MNNILHRKIIGIGIPTILLLMLLNPSIFAQSNSPYLTNGIVVAEFPMHFTDGFMFITVPVIDTDIYGKAITLYRSFILDPAASNEGSFMPDDSNVSITGLRRFYFPISSQRTLIADLVPTLAKGIYKHADTSFFGVLGYAFIRRYITVINFSERTVTFYSTDENTPEWNSRLDTSAIFVPYLDDAILHHCNCQFPTMWFEAKAPPLKEGHVHISLADRQSVIYTQAIDPRTEKILDAQWHQDSIAGNKKSGLNLAKFEIGGVNIAKRNPHRFVAELPPIFRNLNIFIMGTVAIDVLRTFPAIIIDPTRSRVILIR